MAGEETLWIESTRDPGRPGVCLLTWGPLQWYAPLEDVRETALDLMTCAAYAEMMMELVALGLPAPQVSDFTSSILKRDRPFGSPETIELWPAGSSKRRQPLVMLKRGSAEGALHPDEARKMALAWFEAAEATESDQKVTQALQMIRQERIAESLFGTLRKLRTASDA